VRRLRDDVEVKVLANQVAAGLAHASSPGRVGEQVEHRTGQRLAVSCGHQHSVLAVPYHLAAAGHVGGHQRQSQCSGFQ